MRMTLRKSIQGDEFDSQKKYVEKLVAKEPFAERDESYSVMWKDQYGFETGYLVLK